MSEIGNESTSSANTANGASRELPKISRRQFLHIARDFAVLALIPQLARPVGASTAEAVNTRSFSEITGLDEKELQKSGFNIENFEHNPNGGSDYILVIGQTHYNPFIQDVHKSGNAEFMSSQNIIENIIAEIIRNKGIKTVFSEGVSDSSITDLDLLRELKQVLETENLDIASIYHRLEYLKRIELQLFSSAAVSKDITGLAEEPYSYLRGAVYYAFEDYLARAENFINNNPDLEIPPLNKISGANEQIVEPIIHVRNYIGEALKNIGQYLSRYGFQDVRSSLLATTRLHMDGKINVKPAESTELNEQAVKLLQDMLDAKRNLASDPANKDLIRQFNETVSAFNKNKRNYVFERREIEAIRRVTDSEAEGNLRVLVYGDSHDFLAWVKKFNKDHPRRTWGYIQLGKIASEE
ncbi:MAG: hypothetical protein ABIB61_04415 [Candidatus Shapirobacteria bacterium]